MFFFSLKKINDEMQPNCLNQSHIIINPTAQSVFRKIIIRTIPTLYALLIGNFYYICCMPPSAYECCFFNYISKISIIDLQCQNENTIHKG